MSPDRLKTIVQDNCAALKHACGLVDWTIHIEYNRLKEDIGHGAMQGGECRASPNYREAVIVLDPEAFETEDGALRCIRHELLHCLHAEANLYRAQVGEAVSELAFAALDVIYSHMVERIVGNIENMLDVRLGMTPKRMIAAARRTWERDAMTYGKRKKKKRPKKRA